MSGFYGHECDEHCSDTCQGPEAAEQAEMDRKDLEIVELKKKIAELERREEERSRSRRR